MGTLKITSWNVEYLDRLLTPADSASAQHKKDVRLAAVVEQIGRMGPDVLCVVEGPRPDKIDALVDRLGGQYAAVKAEDDQYAIKGVQWIWFLVRAHLAGSASLLPVAKWDAFSAKSWEVHYWGQFPAENHSHYRHPQVLVLDLDGQRVECVGLHLKSKIVSPSQQAMWNDPDRKNAFIEAALKARIKLATEAANVRKYIETKFAQTPNPAIFVMGDMNDGPGKEYFETKYLFFDLISNVQGDVFFARRFLNHALFDYPDDLRWSAKFHDFIMEENRNLLLDHILFTQGLVDGSLPLRVDPGAGLVEHEVHELVNAGQPSYAHTSDHCPVSVTVTI